MAKCLRCACVRNGTPCSRCLPGDAGKCRNINPHPPRGLSSSTPSSLGSNYSASPVQLSRDSSAVASSDRSSLPSICPDLPSFTTNLQASFPTLQHVPKGARDRWARALSECLSAVCVAPADLSCWSKVFMLAKCVLASSATGHRSRWREILKLVRSRIDRWLAGNLVALWSEAVSGGQSLSKRMQSSSRSSNPSHHIRRAKQAVQDGQYSKAIKALSSSGLATPSAEVLQEMLNKHPQAAPPTLPSSSVPPPLTLSESAVRRGVRSFPNGSAAGPSGLRPSDLREAVCCPSPDRANLVLASLTRFVNLLAAGPAPPTVTPHLCGASLANKKKNGGHRPIAIGEVLRRLVSKCLASLVRQPVLCLLAPLQLGVSVQGGCEAIVHATSQLMTSLPGNQCWTLLLDFTNAFNNINREAMFVECRRRLPGLSAWLESCYSCHPLLHLGKDVIHSCCGVQQGDPLGPLGFSLTLHPIVERIKAEVPSLALNAWYFFCLLGCPIGPPSYCEEVLQVRISRIRESLVVLHDMDDSQLETTLLRSCLALPKFSYVLRTCPPSYIDQAVRDLTVGGWTNGAAKKAETSTDDGDIWWQGRLRGIALTRDDQKRLAPVEVETKRGAIPLDYVQCSRETLRGTHQGAIVEVPGIQSKRGYLGLDTLDNGVES